MERGTIQEKGSRIKLQFELMNEPRETAEKRRNRVRRRNQKRKKLKNNNAANQEMRQRERDQSSPLMRLQSC